jgi:tetratricopeptide (TPR) repeat protein
VSDEHDDPIPDELGRYRILSRLGTGGMAEVFLAKSTGAEGIEKVLVVKRVLPTFARSSKFIAMFTAEAQVAVRLNHPNIVQVYGFEQVKNQFLLAMEFVDGLDLGRLRSAARRAGRRLPPGLAAFVVMDAAKGLDYAHKRRDDDGEPLEIVHRDVSPQNVLISYEGTVKVADFGIAKARLVTEETGVIKGKFAYMSPEQARGERVDRRSDVYSLGILLAELLMDRAMYPGRQGLDVLEEVRVGRRTLPREVDPTVPEELEAIVAKATSLEAGDRYDTARIFASRLAQYLHEREALPDGGEALERFIAEVAPRQGTHPAQAKAPTLRSEVPPGEAELRERRHVVAVSGRVRVPGPGLEEGGTAPGVGAEAARVLEAIAYKVDAVLSWPEGPEAARFRFILGLGKPSVNDPLHAIGLALDVREALQGLSADLDVPLTAALGVSRGIVSTVRDRSGRLLRYEAVGSVLEVARGLSDMARPGEVLVAGEVYRLSRRVYAFDEHGAREAHYEGSGRRHSIRAYRVRGALTRSERSADAMARPDGEGLVGRDDELRSLAETYQEVVTSGAASWVAVEGDLGLGKSALVAAALDTFEPEPRVIRCECAFGTQDVPFAAAAELVREALGITDESDSADPSQADAPSDARWSVLRERADAALANFDAERRQSALRGLELLFGVIEGAGEANAPDAGDEDRSRLIMQSIEALLRGLAQRGPVVVWLDALQWADTPTLALARMLVQNPFSDAQILGILTTRPDPRTQPVVSAAPQITLSGLAPEHRRQLVRSRFEGARVPAEIERAIVERAGGNPFFLQELVDALVERGAVAIEGDGAERRVVRRPELAIALPTSLEGVIAARLGELDELERRALRWLAVAGPGLRDADLASLAGGDMAGVLRRLEERRLLRRRPGGAYAFPSAVIRHVAYETTDADDRVVMHRRIADFLAKQGHAAPARIARHLEHAGEQGAAAEAYFDAAQAARRVYSNQEALRLYGRALALLPFESERRFWAHEACGQIYRGMGRRVEQLRELEAMRSLAERASDGADGGRSRRALVYNRLARFWLDAAELDGVEAHLRHAMEAAVAAEDRGGEVEALRQTAQLAVEQGEIERALAACDRALTRAGTELLAARGSVLVQRAQLLRRIGRVDEALADDAEAVVIFRRLGIKRNEAHALNALGVVLATRGSFEDAILVIRASIHLDLEIGDRFLLGRKLSNVGQLYWELGDAERALAFLGRSLDVFKAVDDQGARADARTAMAEALLEGRGDAESASRELDRARELAVRTGDLYDLARERIARASLEALAGQLDRSAALAREAVDYAREGGLVAHELQGMCRLAESLAVQGNRDEALDLARRARAELRAHGSERIERAERVHAAVARTLAALGERDEAQAARLEASAFVETRVRRIRDEALKRSYLARDVVREVQEGANL